MSVSSKNKTHRRLTGKRLAILLAISVATAAGLLFGGYWLQARVPAWFYWQTGLVFLIALEIAYGITVLATSLGAVVIAALLFKHRGKAPSRRKLARGLLLCGSLALGLLLAEATSRILAPPRKPRLRGSRRRSAPDCVVLETIRLESRSRRESKRPRYLPRSPRRPHDRHRDRG